MTKAFLHSGNSNPASKRFGILPFVFLFVYCTPLVRKTVSPSVLLSQPLVFPIKLHFSQFFKKYLLNFVTHCAILFSIIIGDREGMCLSIACKIFYHKTEMVSSLFLLSFCGFAAFFMPIFCSLLSAQKQIPIFHFLLSPFTTKQTICIIYCRINQKNS